MSGLGELDRHGSPSDAEPCEQRSRKSIRTEAESGGTAGATETETESGERSVHGSADLDLASDAAPEAGVGLVAGAVAGPVAGATGGVEAPGARPTVPAARRAGAADPVKALMHRHRELCERAVDPLEIAAGLEAHGVTDRTAARFRHRDVFSLAEEMYARVPRDGETPSNPTSSDAPQAGAGQVLLTLLPGALCTGTVVGLHLTHGRARLTIAAVGVLAVALGVRAALDRGQLGTRGRTQRSATGAWTAWLVAYAVLGDGLLGAALAGGPDNLPDGTANSPWPLATAPALALAWACAPAALSAHLFAVRVGRRLTASRGLEDFAASVRPLLLGTFALFLVALTALLAGAGRALDESPPYAQTLTLGALLFLARLLAVHGFTHAPKAVLAVAAASQASALATVFAARLPGCDLLAVPVQTITDAWGPGAVPTLICGLGALTLLVHALRTLTRASAHAHPGEQP
ncbi:hypothetical protein ABZ027_02210 [Streptomyces sp. NPDC006332]|uniref:hypothetical protein n=1 Tax=Streptomyces sp. NPDC006332 TaxID=3155456 RepID=UPI0033B8BA47